MALVTIVALAVVFSLHIVLVQADTNNLREVVKVRSGGDGKPLSARGAAAEMALAASMDEEQE